MPDCVSGYNYGFFKFYDSTNILECAWVLFRSETADLFHSDKLSRRVCEMYDPLRLTDGNVVSECRKYFSSDSEAGNLTYNA